MYWTGGPNLNETPRLNSFRRAELPKRCVVHDGALKRRSLGCKGLAEVEHRLETVQLLGRRKIRPDAHIRQRGRRLIGTAIKDEQSRHRLNSWPQDRVRRDHHLPHFHEQMWSAAQDRHSNDRFHLQSPLGSGWIGAFPAIDRARLPAN